MKFLISCLCSVLFLSLFSYSATTKSTNASIIPDSSKEKIINSLSTKYPTRKGAIIRSVNHAASLWRKENGSTEEFINFCNNNYIADEKMKKALFSRCSEYFESLWGHSNKMSLDLQKNLHLDTGSLLKIDKLFGSYNPGAHLTEDLYNNRIAFIIALNFPPYSLEEKNDLGNKWSDLQWGYARMGDLFNARVPSNLVQEYNRVSTETDIYISEYNIHMGHVIKGKKKSLFPEKMVLLSHWNLRDEIKANYAIKNRIAKQKQDTVYQVMKRIIAQSIPANIINSNKYNWDPFKNKVYSKGKEVAFTPEPDKRYLQIIKNFRALKKIDKYHPVLNTYIKRKFSGEMEIPQPEVEKLFHQFLSSPVMPKIAKLIKKRLGRKLEAYDIWYDGFKARSTISEDKLNSITRKRYPNAAALKKDLPALLKKLSFENADFLASKIDVDPARGSGHAWGASMKSETAHLRTRIPSTGMDYKGYNIAIHEFGHNVEQTISLHNVSNYMINGVPNTSFTEALAFLFQKKDLQLLDIVDNNKIKEHLKALDICWSTFEIMGVSMVDMKVWKWLYQNPDADEHQLKEAVIRISKEVWNKYFAKAYGKKNEPVLAIYSHMISYPLYLSAYSFGQLIEFQLGEHMKTRNFAKEVNRIFKQGRLTPSVWMKKAVGSDLSPISLIQAAQKALKYVKK